MRREEEPNAETDRARKNGSVIFLSKKGRQHTSPQLDGGTGRFNYWLESFI